MNEAPLFEAIEATLIDATRAAQAKAADPLASAWVSANAGTGKTYVLVLRVLRLLLAGTAPDRILCLTYTKAAAAEMSKRLFDRLAAWTTMPDVQLAEELAKLQDGSGGPGQIARARTLFARAIETPGGLKVQTIHAFSERLLQRFPLEAGVAPGFAILDDETKAELLAACTNRVLSTAGADPLAPLGQALAVVVRFAASERFDEVLRGVVEQRAKLANLIRMVGTTDDPLTAIEASLRANLGLEPAQHGPDEDGKLLESLANVLAAGTIDELISALAGGLKTDQEGAAKLRLARATEAFEPRAAALADYFLTGKGEIRKRLMTAAIETVEPALAMLAPRAAERFHALTLQRRALTVVRSTIAVLRLGDAVIGGYAAAKADRSALDYEDLIVRTVDLLGTSESAAWVLYKLDSGLEHILVDEAQDTSPSQWQIVESLVAEFFAGLGAAADRGTIAGAVTRTLFAVGDEKQSIYGFQGAAPEMFARMGRAFAERASDARQPFHRVPLTLSFRTVAPVLATVDRVFQVPERKAGLSADPDAIIRHEASRIGHAGLVELWPAEPAEEQPEAAPWLPFDDATSAQSPSRRLADRVAKQIATWLDGGERLVSEDRPIRPGDILILVKKRRPFAPVIIKALKDRGIPVAGADRIRINEHIAVADLMVLGDFLLLPEDDLALATILKSPLFGLDDDALFAAGHGRKGTLWQAFLAHAEGRPEFAGHVALLKRWRSEADYLPPYEFFAKVLATNNNRGKMLGRLGPEAGEAIDEFLSLAIRYDEMHPPSMQGFLDWLRRSAPEIKRDMDQGRNEVRVMTVHGAKGLEAPIVILPDTCSTRGARDSSGLLEIGEAEPAKSLVFMVKGAGGIESVGAAKEAAENREKQEYDRLLYVAMTRARDRLYVAGFEGRHGRDKGCWHEAVETALREIGRQVVLPDGRRVIRYHCEQTAPVEAAKAVETAHVTVPLPAFATTPAPAVAPRNIPIAPSRLAPIETEDGTDFAPPQEPAFGPGSRGGTGNRFERGLLTHALFQYLPPLPPDVRKSAGKKFLEHRAPGLSKASTESILREVLRVTEDPQHRALFGPDSEAEIGVVARFDDPAGLHPAIEVAGSIDRLHVTAETVRIVDFKSNRPPPEGLDGVPEAYFLQLAAYRKAVAAVYPGRQIEGYLLWTFNARLMPIPPALLNAAELKLFSAALK